MAIGPPPLTPRSTVVVGVDPGMTGAIAVVGTDARFRAVYDMPITKMGRAGEYDVAEIVKLVATIMQRYHVAVCALEWPQTRPHEAVESAKRFGVGLGVLAGVWGAAGVIVERVAPNKWKGQLGLQGKARDQYAARRQAADQALGLVEGLKPADVLGPRGGVLDGRAEAVLIAWWRATKTLEGLRALDEDTRLARVLFGSGSRRRGGNLTL